MLRRVSRSTWNFSCMQLSVNRVGTVAASADSLTEGVSEEVKPFSEIPGPKSYPIVKSLPAFLPIIGKPVAPSDLPYFHEEMYRKYGNLTRIELPGGRNLLFVNDPNTARDMLKHATGKWPIRDHFQYLKKYRTEMRKEIYGSPGVAISNGHQWHSIRSKVQQPMMRPKNSLNYIPVMDKIALEFIDHIKRIKNQRGEIATNFSEELYKWALDSIAVVALNTKFGCFSPSISSKSETQAMIDNVQKSMIAMGNLETSQLNLWRYFITKDLKDLIKALDATSEICYKKIIECQEALRSKLKDKEEEEEEELSILEKFLTTPGMSVKDAHTMAMDMLFAGVDTTGTTMGFLLYNISQSPEVQERLHEEIETVLPSSETPLTPKILSQLPYMKACVKESMRILPVTVGFGRVSEKDAVVDGYHIPKGTELVFGNVMCRLEKHFSEPLKYKPERWLKGDPGQHTADPYTYMPFGHGPRMCIGRRFAEQEMWVLLTRMSQNFILEKQQDDIRLVFRLINTSDRPLEFKFMDR